MHIMSVSISEYPVFYSQTFEENVSLQYNIPLRIISPLNPKILHASQEVLYLRDHVLFLRACLYMKPFFRFLKSASKELKVQVCPLKRYFFFRT